MLCPVCKENLVLNRAGEESEHPSVTCSGRACGFQYVERLDNHDHAVVLEMNANTRRISKVASAEAKLAQMFNMRNV